MAKSFADTPLMKQYAEMKRKHPDAILLFRVGDFYETFSEDAVEASRILGITLTRRGNGAAAGTELAGFPHHALDTYLPKLVRAGKRVAICEQLEDPKLTKKLVKRGITELVTPGLNTADSSLPPRENNFLGALHFGRPDRAGRITIGAAFLDLTTGEFLTTQGSPEFIDKLMAGISPKETIRMRGTRQLCEKYLCQRTIYNELDDWVYTQEAARTRLQRQFGTDTLKGFGIDLLPEAVVAAGSVLHYLDYTSHTNTSHITSIARIDSGKHLYLDRFTLRNLEILHAQGEEGKSLIDILDKTVTPPGSRLLKQWFAMPLLDISVITERQNAVEEFFRQPQMRTEFTEALRKVGDLGRLAGRLANQRISPRDMRQLAASLQMLGEIRTRLLEQENPEQENPALRAIGEDIHPLPEVIGEINRTVTVDAPADLRKGDFIAPGFNAELDRLRKISRHSKEALEDIVKRESEATGIPSLKIGFNNVFGYYIEVRNTHKHRVPESWVRRQTLTSGERYITAELKEYEDAITGANDKIEVLEHTIYRDLMASVTAHIADITLDAAAAARLDCLLSMAAAAEEYRYVRPVIDDSKILDIKGGRHPVIERQLPPGEPYVANDVHLDDQGVQIMMITGPNMSGKSALLRQTALITLMAQTGSFVPAESARIGMVDKIMSRVGASDNISAGESTFMVEMNEAAAILNNMSERSLILFDELGRGTSTYDGISIAWAIVEHIHENGRCRPKTLFATHYHELNEMEKSFKRIANYNVSVKEAGGKVVFMRKLARGGSEHSFGIHVAKLAGMPPSIVKRAGQVLSQLEGEGAKSPKADLGDMGANREGYQMSLFQLDDPLLMDIRDALIDLDIDNLTPLKALEKLHDLQALLKG